jgi:hypothetical protein
MRRGFAVLWHALSFLLAGVLFFLFVLPRWWELMGEVSHGLGTAMRIITGAVLGLTALPVVFTLIKSRRPELGTPQLALSLRQWSIVGHLLAAVLIIGAAIAEIWLSLDDAGQWLFGVYGAAAAIALLAALAFYLAFVAELPPAPPKPLKPKKTKKDKPPEQAAEHDGATAEAADEAAEAKPEPEPEPEAEAEPEPKGLRNRRPAGKSHAR